MYGCELCSATFGSAHEQALHGGALTCLKRKYATLTAELEQARADLTDARAWGEKREAAYQRLRGQRDKLRDERDAVRAELASSVDVWQARIQEKIDWGNGLGNDLLVAWQECDDARRECARLIEQRDAQIRAPLEQRIVMLERQAEAALNQRDAANERAQRAEEIIAAARDVLTAEANGDLVSSTPHESLYRLLDALEVYDAAHPPRAGEVTESE